MDRDQLLTRLDRAWQALGDSFAGLTEARMMQPGVAGSWSVKDVLAHVTTWEEEALQHLPTILAGGKPPRYSVSFGGINAFNAQMTERKKNLSLEDVLRQMKNTHRRFVEYLRGIPEDQFRGETPFRRRLRLDTYSHYAKHAAAIRNWRGTS